MKINFKIKVICECERNRETSTAICCLCNICIKKNTRKGKNIILGLWYLSPRSTLWFCSYLMMSPCWKLYVVWVTYYRSRSEAGLQLNLDIELKKTFSNLKYDVCRMYNVTYDTSHTNSTNIKHKNNRMCSWYEWWKFSWTAAIFNLCLHQTEKHITHHLSQISWVNPSMNVLWFHCSLYLIPIFKLWGLSNK